MRIIVRIVLLPLLWLLGAIALAAPLITAPELQALAGDGEARVIDLRAPDDYAGGHIPGAISAAYGRWRGPSENPGQLLSLDEFTDLVQQLGLEPDQHIVIVYAGANSTDFGSAARVYWTLKSLGAEDLSILNGGLKAWEGAGLPVDSRAPEVARSDWQPKWDSRWSISREELQSSLDSATLVDARPEAFYEGRTKAPAARVAGTLPGAINIDNARFFEPGSAELMGRDAIAERVAELPASTDRPTVSFCNTGHWASTDWFVFSEILQRPNTRLYAGSMVDWTLAPEPLPIANEPSRWQQLASMTRGWIDRTLKIAR